MKKINITTYKFLRPLFIVCLFLGFIISGCDDDAAVVKHNMTKAADNFEINRRILFYNTWTDTVIQQVEGRCSIEYGDRVSLICKVGENQYKRNFISLSGQVAVFVEQLKPLPTNAYHYRRTFKPQSVIPDIDFRGSSKALVENHGQ
jgi:hypothetical protein